MMGGVLGAEALRYVGMGLAVFPLKPRDKRPNTRNGRNDGCNYAPNIEKWWNAHPYDNIGIITGTEAYEGTDFELFVLDFDVHDGTDGLSALSAWENEHGALPMTASAETGSGGYHLYYRTRHEVRCSTNAALGVDVRGRGGYVVAPPSVHPCGDSYVWINDPDECGIAEADGNVLSFLEHVQGGAQMAGDWTKYTAPDLVKVGERNDQVFKYACSLQSKSYDDGDIAQLVRAFNADRCAVPMEAEEVDKIIKSVLRLPKGKSLDYRKYRDEAAAQEPATVPLRLSKNGAPMQTAANFEKVFTLDSRIAGRLWYDTTAYTKMVTGPLPWDDAEGDRAAADSDYLGAQTYCEEQYMLTSKQKGVDAFKSVCYKNKRNPMRDWLDGLEWDGDPHAEALLTMFLGAEPSDYTCHVSRLMVLGAVARIYNPGEKFDYMPVLIGEQGQGKSSFLELLAGTPERYLDLKSLDGDAAIEKLRGKWIIEIGELLALKSVKDVEAIKAFITTRNDTIRPKYAIETETRPRTCIFVGTTNNSTFLTDKTGNRRFLPVRCGVVEPSLSVFDADVGRREVEQALAECVHIWKTERPALVMPREISEQVARHTDAHMEEDPRVGLIQEYLDRRGGHDGVDGRVCAMEILEFALEMRDAHTVGAGKLVNEIHFIMQEQIEGWERLPGKNMTRSYGIQRCYVRKKD